MDEFTGIAQRLTAITGKNISARDLETFCEKPYIRAREFEEVIPRYERLKGEIHHSGCFGDVATFSLEIPGQQQPYLSQLGSYQFKDQPRRELMRMTLNNLVHIVENEPGQKRPRPAQQEVYGGCVRPEKSFITNII